MRKLNQLVSYNFKNLKSWVLLPAFLVLLAVFLLVLIQEGNFREAYIDVQKEWFFYFNEKLSIFPNFQFNITQLGDVLVVFPFMLILVYYVPRFWGALFISSLLSLGVSAGLKLLFAMPRPAKVFDIEGFTIIGERINYNSLPSGHSITAIICIVLLLFAFMPRKNKLYQFLWTFFILLIGLIIVSSRVGIGAHYPLDVVAGSAIGYILAFVGIKIVGGIGLKIENIILFLLYS